MKKIICSKGITTEVSINPDAQVNEILENLFEARRVKGLKQADVAEEIEVSGAQYGNLESGRNQMTVRQLFRIIEILEVPLNDVFNYPEEIPDKTMKTINDLKEEIIREREISSLALEKIKRIESATAM
jgi:transcriptional regulator with XRE-family HTH domain